MKKRILSVAMSLTFVVLCFAGLAFSGAALTPTLPTNWNNTWSSPDVTISADDNGTKAVFGGTIGSSDKGVEYKTGLTGSWTVAGGLEFPSGSGVDPRFSITFRNTSGKLVFTLQSNATDDLYWKLTLEANNAVSIAGSDDRPAFNLATDDSPYNDGGWLKAPDRTNKYSWQISHQTGTTVLALNIMAEDGTVITSQLIQTNVSFFTGTANSGFWGAALTWGVQTEDKNTGVARNLQADTVYTAPADVTPYITTTASDTTDTTGATDTDTTDTDAGATDTTAAGGATTTEAIVDKPTTAGDWTLNGVTAATLSGQFAGQFARSTAGTMTYAGPT
ncbi:MAG: hypothetical protein FWF49_02565, partial [Oscillospiraceae bacterium]|nr:hypothetical protein [Oscillospiraceae bacterium]